MNGISLMFTKLDVTIYKNNTNFCYHKSTELSLRTKSFSIDKTSPKTTTHHLASCKYVNSESLITLEKGKEMQIKISSTSRHDQAMSSTLLNESSNSHYSAYHSKQLTSTSVAI